MSSDIESTISFGNNIASWAIVTYKWSYLSVCIKQEVFTNQGDLDVISGKQFKNGIAFWSMESYSVVSYLVWRWARWRAGDSEKPRKKRVKNNHLHCVSEYCMELRVFWLTDLTLIVSLVRVQCGFLKQLAHRDKTCWSSWSKHFILLDGYSFHGKFINYKFIWLIFHKSLTLRLTDEADIKKKYSYIWCTLHIEPEFGSVKVNEKFWKWRT